MSLQDPNIIDFKARFPALSDAAAAAPDTVTFLIEDAKLEISCCALGGYYSKAVLHHAAHFFILEINAALNNVSGEANASLGAQGQITSASVGDVSVSQDFAISADAYSGSWGNFPTTVYGQELVRILKKMGKGPLIANKAETQPNCAAQVQGVCL